MNISAKTIEIIIKAGISSQNSDDVFFYHELYRTVYFTLGYETQHR